MVGLNCVLLKFLRNAFTRTYVSWNPMDFRKRDLHQISMKCFLKKSLWPTIWWAFRKKSQSDLLRQGYHMKHPVESLVFTKYPQEKSLCSAIWWALRIRNSLDFLKQWPHMKHRIENFIKSSHKMLLQEMPLFTGNFRRKLCFIFCCI